MMPATRGGSVSQSLGSLRQEKPKQIMEGRATEVQKANRGVRLDRAMPGDADETNEVTRLLHRLVTEVARVHRDDSGTAAPPNLGSPEELAAALPKWKRFLDLAIVTLLLPVWLP